MGRRSSPYRRNTESKFGIVEVVQEIGWIVFLGSIVCVLA